MYMSTLGKNMVLLPRCLFNQHLLGLLLICALCLPGCVASQADSQGPELPSPREHSAFKRMILAQPEFTEDELLKFQEDLAPTVDMPKEEALPYLEANNGWPRDRSTYLILKMGLASESIVAGRDYAELFPIIPPELYPSKTETALVRKHADLILPLFTPPGSKAAERTSPRTNPVNLEKSPSLGVHP